eukprot:TRINITY_DN8363_c0_g1_i1.p1 TRINITY_DN8363_c0_g1~~TRINITY_DN8363_c0_g1_i1.p1  ORF type:complete len:2345 (+),score=475.68 TRINITY_DN8363_c0_g1_i1:27-7061(+)
MNPKKVAIIGMGMEMPGNITCSDDLLNYLSQNNISVSEIPEGRWDKSTFYDQHSRNGKLCTNYGNFLSRDVFDMDVKPFKISNKEALSTDPQQLLLLESSLAAFQDAGIPTDDLRGSKVGCYIGGFAVDSRDMEVGNINNVSPLNILGFGHTMLAARISYVFDLDGPSMTVDTACSSSLVAVDLGVKAIERGEVEMSVVGGVNMLGYPSGWMMHMSAAGILSKDGRCKTFEEDADGFGRSEGVGVLILKDYEKAITDGNRIYAVFEGIGTNHDGFSQGVAQPSMDRQIKLAQEVVEASSINPANIVFVEAHGTGTKVGDPIECNAIGEVYGNIDRKFPVYISSIKSNIGHMEAAAGVVGLIKVALSLYTSKLYGLSELRKQNPAINFEELGLQPFTDVIDLKDIYEFNNIPFDQPMYAAINSFGYGGTNVHAILSQYKDDRIENNHSGVNNTGTMNKSVIIPVSAASEESLDKYLEVLDTFISKNRSISTDIFSTLTYGRSNMNYRAGIVIPAGEQFNLKKNKVSRGVKSGNEKIVYVFTGMGPQSWNMGRELFEKEPIFKEALLHVDYIFSNYSGWSILDEMFSPDTEESSKISENYIAMPANFVIQVGLVQLYKSLGVEPAAVIGHSVGEIAAAWASGCISLEEATYLTYLRSTITEKVSNIGGGMLSLNIPREDVNKYLDAYPAKVSLACVNGPNSYVLSGDKETLQSIKEELEVAGVKSYILRVKVAYHSYYLKECKELMLEKYAEIFANEHNAKTPTVPFFSTSLGESVKSTSTFRNPLTWYRNARRSVLLNEAINLSMNNGYESYLEIGPHPVLGYYIREIAKERNVSTSLYYSLHRKESEQTSVLKSVSNLYVSGSSTIDWSLQFTKGAIVSLPKYEFVRNVHREGFVDLRVSGSVHPFLKFNVLDQGRNMWKADLCDSKFEYLLDHQINNVIIFPGAGYLEMMLATELLFDTNVFSLANIKFSHPLSLSDSVIQEIEISAIDSNLEIRSISGGVYNTNIHASGESYSSEKFDQRYLYTTKELENLENVNINNEMEAFYQNFQSRGMDYGPYFRNVKTIYQLSDNHCYGILNRIVGDHWIIHPATLDCSFQIALSLISASDNIPETSSVVPVSIDRITYFKDQDNHQNEVIVEIKKIKGDADGIIVNLSFANITGEVIYYMRGLVLKTIHTSDEIPILEAYHDFLLIENEEEYVGETSKIIDVGYSINLQKINDTVNTLLVNESYGCGEHLCADFTSIITEVLEEIATLVVITKNAYLINDDQNVNLAHRALIGYIRSARLEIPELCIKVLDTDTSVPNSVIEKVSSDDNTEEYAFRKGKLYKNVVNSKRIEYEQPEQNIDESSNFKIYCSETGKYTTLCIEQETNLKRLNSTDIEVKVQYSALNFKDVLKYSGIYTLTDELNITGGSEYLGLEACGTITRVGINVKNYREGDNVYIMGPQCLSSHVITDSSYAYPIPELLPEYSTFIPIITAYYSLLNVAKLKRGENVLIHSAMGGVGLSAVQIVQRIGGVVFATAGTEEKRKTLRDMGIKHVYNSRTLDFYDQIRDEGFEMDVVLNSLTGDKLKKSLELCGTSSRFVDIGKKDFWENNQLPMHIFRKGVMYCSVDIESCFAKDPHIFKDVMASILENDFADVFPQNWLYNVYPLAEYKTAFSTLRTGNRHGKLVIDFDDKTNAMLIPNKNQTIFDCIDASKYYLIVGGMTGLGLATALYLANNNAKKLILASRTIRDTPQLDELDIELYKLAFDIADYQSLMGAITSLKIDISLIDGVFHSGGIKDDMPFTENSIGSVKNVFRAKALGAANLDKLEAELGLNYSLFVIYSSMSAFLGNKGQSSYSAANSYTSALIEQRNMKGLVGSSLYLPPVSDTGMVGNDVKAHQYFRTLGVRPITIAELLPNIFATPIVGNTFLAAIDMKQWVSCHSDVDWNRFSELYNQNEDNSDTKFIECLDDYDYNTKLTMIIQIIEDAFRTSLLIPKDENLSYVTSFQEMGLDSITTTAIQSLLSSQGLTFTIMEILTLGSFEKMAVTWLKKRESAVKKTSKDDTKKLEKQNDQDFNISEYCKVRIGATAPYFNLSENLKRENNWLVAPATFKKLPFYDMNHFSNAESSRQLCLIASCAATLVIRQDTKFYFPVKKLVLRNNNILQKSSKDELLVRSRVIEKNDVLVKCEIQVLDAEGTIYQSGEAHLHVLTEKMFQNIGKDHEVDTSGLSKEDAYENWDMLEDSLVELISDNEATCVLNRVHVDACKGHFDNYPALPASVLVRKVFDLVYYAENMIDNGRVFKIKEGVASFQSLIWVGCVPRLVAKSVELSSEETTWSVDVFSNDVFAGNITIVLEK